MFTSAKLSRSRFPELIIPLGGLCITDLPLYLFTLTSDSFSLLCLSRCVSISRTYPKTDNLRDLPPCFNSSSKLCEFILSQTLKPKICLGFELSLQRHQFSGQIRKRSTASAYTPFGTNLGVTLGTMCTECTKHTRLTNCKYSRINYSKIHTISHPNPTQNLSVWGKFVMKVTEYI